MLILRPKSHNEKERFNRPPNRNSSQRRLATPKNRQNRAACYFRRQLSQLFLPLSPAYWKQQGPISGTKTLRVAEHFVSSYLGPGRVNFAAYWSLHTYS